MQHLLFWCLYKRVGENELPHCACMAFPGAGNFAHFMKPILSAMNSSPVLGLLSHRDLFNLYYPPVAPDAPEALGSIELAEGKIVVWPY